MRTLSQPAPASDATADPPTRPAVRLAGVALPEAQLTVDLLAPERAVTIVTGGPGAGKTVLLETLGLLRLPGGGRMAIFGEDPRKLSAGKLARLRRRIGRLRQTPLLFEHMSAFENVAVPLRLAGRAEPDYAADVDEILAYVGLKPGDPAPAAALSDTARRRVALARALAIKPELLLADEPAAGLGPEPAGRMLKILLAAPRMGAALVLATQDDTLPEALPRARWFAIEDGALRLRRRDETGA